MGQTTLNWQYDGPNPDSFSVYRADAPMDPDALPTPLATAISGALRTYVDTTVVADSTYYYRVSAVKGTVEKVSDEIEHVAEVAGDPSWLAVRSLLMFEGTNGGTTFTDEVSGTTWGSPSLATTSTDQAKFGTTSYKGTSGTDSHIQTGDVALVTTSLTFFTIEAWVYLSAYANNPYFGNAIFSQSCSGGGCEQVLTVSTAGRLVYYRGPSHSGGLLDMNSGADGDVPLNQWVHVAATFDGRYVRLFINGVKKATSAAQSTGWVDTSNPQYVGHVVVPGYTQYRSSLLGYIDAFRLTNDCRYINDFVVPTEAPPVIDRVVNTSDSFDTDLLATNYITVEDTPGTFAVSGGALTITTNGSYQSKLSPQDVYFADGYVEGDFTRGDDAGLVLRMRGRDNYYLAVFKDASSSQSNPGTASLYKKVNGAYTLIGSTTYALPTTWTRGVSNTFRFTASGTTLTLTQNGATVFSLTDSAHAHGRVAVRGNGGSSSQTVCQRLAASG